MQANNKLFSFCVLRILYVRRQRKVTKDTQQRGRIDTMPTLISLVPHTRANKKYQQFSKSAINWVLYRQVVGNLSPGLRLNT